METIEYGIGKPFSPLFNIEECTLICLERSENTFNRVMESIGIDEINAVAESGEIVIYEEFSISKIKDSIINWLKEAFANVKRVVDNALKTIKQKIDDFNDKIDKRVGDIIKKLGQRAKDIKDGEKSLGKYYTYDALDDAIAGKYNGKDFWTIIRAVGMGFMAHAESIHAKQNAGDKSEADRTKQEINEYCFKKLGFKENIKTSEITAEIKKVLQGSEKKDFKKIDIVNGKYYINALADQATNFSKNKRDVSAEYNKCKKLFDDYIKAVNKYFKEDKSLVGLKDCVSGIKTMTHVAQCFNGAILSCIIGRLSRNMAIVVRVAVAVKEKPVEESYSMENVQTEISSLFSF